MIAQRLIELRQSASTWRENVPRLCTETPSNDLIKLHHSSDDHLTCDNIAFSSHGSLGQFSHLSCKVFSEFFKKSTPTHVLDIVEETGSDKLTGENVDDNNSTTPKCRRSMIEERKLRLAESSEGWRKRISIDPMLSKIDSEVKLRIDHGINSINRRSASVDITKGFDAFFSTVNIPATSDESDITLTDLNDITVSEQRLSFPLRAPLKRTYRNKRSKKLPEFSVPEQVEVPPAIIDELETLMEENDDDFSMPISKSAKKGLEATIDYTSVKLRKLEIKSSYPELMLVRIQGTNHIDVRLVAPKVSSVRSFGAFLLITPTRLFSYSGQYSTLRERTKATLLATDICGKNGELDCHAKVVEIVNEESRSDFWKLLGHTSRDRPLEEEMVIIELNANKFDDLIEGVNVVYQVCDDRSISVVLKSALPKISLLQPKKNLIFDFGSEIYVWSGRGASRLGVYIALQYAEQLRSKGVFGLSPNDYQLFGDNLSENRPNWCINTRLTHGLETCLFRSKFVDWKNVQKGISSPFSLRNSKQSPNAPPQHSNIPLTIGSSLKASSPEQLPLVLEDTPLDRNANNIFTEGLEFFELQSEGQLQPLDALDLLLMDRCYVIKWRYRVERPGIRTFAGGKRSHEFGRPRTVFFYWLGSQTTKKQQGLCAMALRNLDKDRYPHVRVLQGQEHPIFLQLFQGEMIVAGTLSNIFLVFGSSILSEYRTEELSAPVIFRSQGVYLLVNDRITLWYGRLTKTQTRQAAKTLANKLRTIRHPHFTSVSSSTEVIEMYDPEVPPRMTVLHNDEWRKAPRMIRLFGEEAEEEICVQWDSESSFSFRQEILRGTMLVDQGSRLWIWSDNFPTNLHLRIARAYWDGRSGSKTVIYRAHEPSAFKALFPEWTDFGEDQFSNDIADGDPTDLDKLLSMRSQCFTYEQLISRNLPPGTDLEHLEEYLNDNDFKSIFAVDRCTFYTLPQWKQNELRKQNKLF
ncbi:hypothetical protein AB6A40_001381 [Gnathostoma spinigerum]|uniref:HP domain-containing protein n=1 Tax=Gnathostoma spinigerum TaxID=75299 RepID=A0ABD6EDA3_9BILA